MYVCMHVCMILGLDFAGGLATHNHPHLFFLAMLYMCITAFGLLNGLVGIFGDVFVNASKEAFEKRTEKTSEVQAVIVVVIVVLAVAVLVLTIARSSYSRSSSTCNRSLIKLAKPHTKLVVVVVILAVGSSRW